MPHWGLWESIEHTKGIAPRGGGSGVNPAPPALQRWLLVEAASIHSDSQAFWLVVGRATGAGDAAGLVRNHAVGRELTAQAVVRPLHSSAHSCPVKFTVFALLPPSED